MYNPEYITNVIISDIIDSLIMLMVMIIPVYINARQKSKVGYLITGSYVLMSIFYNFLDRFDLEVLSKYNLIITIFYAVFYILFLTSFNLPFQQIYGLYAALMLGRFLLNWVITKVYQELLNYDGMLWLVDDLSNIGIVILNQLIVIGVTALLTWCLTKYKFWKHSFLIVGILLLLNEAVTTWYITSSEILYFETIEQYKQVLEKYFLIAILPFIIMVLSALVRSFIPKYRKVFVEETDEKITQMESSEFEQFVDEIVENKRETRPKYKEFIIDYAPIKGVVSFKKEEYKLLINKALDYACDYFGHKITLIVAEDRAKIDTTVTYTKKGELSKSQKRNQKKTKKEMQESGFFDFDKASIYVKPKKITINSNPLTTV